jgi:hypothetical protein
MLRTWRNRIGLTCCAVVICNLLAYFGISRPAPEPAEASRVIASPSMQPIQQPRVSAEPAISAEPTISPCQYSINQIVGIVKDEHGRIDRSQPLAAIDRCVARQDQIDFSRCPRDFQIAAADFVQAEKILCRDAHIDAYTEPQVIEHAFFAVYAHQSPYDSLDRMSDRMKRDVDNFQSAAFNLIEASSNHDVK